MLIPVNFLLSLMCLLLLLQRRDIGRMFQALLLLCLIHSLVAGLALLAEGGWRWLQPVTAAALPLMSCLALERDGGTRTTRAVCGVALVLMVASVLLMPQMIDWLMPAIWLSCAARMLLRLRPAAETDCVLAESPLTPAAWRLLALMLIVVALLDMALSLLTAFADRAGVHGVMLAGNLATAGVMSLMLHMTPPGAMPAVARVQRAAGEDDQRIVACVDALMREGLYREPQLNLARLARKAGIPARQVSAAVNALHQQSVSHYVNSWRVREAGELLAGSRQTVISVMEQVGFQTKSNFNREFLRLTGKTPSQWRKDAGEHDENRLKTLPGSSG